MPNSQSRDWASFQILCITLCLTVMIFVAKTWAGWTTRSLCLLAEALRTSVDCFSIVLSLLVLTAPSPSGRPLWGHTRRESRLAIGLAAVLGFAGFNLFGMAIEYLAGGLQFETLLPDVRWPLLHLMGGILAVRVCLMLFERYESRVLQDAVLRLNARQMLQDLWSEGALLLGLVAIAQGIHWLDPLLAIGLLLLTGRSFWRVLDWQMPFLVQQVAIAPEVVVQLVSQVEGVAECNQVRSRGVVGRQVFVELELTLHPHYLKTTHYVLERVEATLRDRFGPVATHIRIQPSQPNAVAQVHLSDAS